MIALAIFLSLLISTFTTVFMAWLLNKSHKEERKIDMDRQDRVAIQVVNASDITNEKLDTIHILVNSNMTAALQAELDATIRELAMMKEVIALNRAAGRAPSNEASKALEMTQAKIRELTAQLNDRLRQTRIADLKQEKEELKRTMKLTKEE